MDINPHRFETNSLNSSIIQGGATDSNTNNYYNKHLC